MGAIPGKNMIYYKRQFDETRVENFINWGTCLYYFEVNDLGEVKRQLEIYDNGKRIKYDPEFSVNEFGFLTDKPLDRNEFEKYTITKIEFETVWNEK